MNYKKLAKQDYFFIDCNSSYLQSALSYYAENNKNDLLLFLADCELRYADKVDTGNAKNDPAIYDKDPFYSQPIRLYNNQSEILFNQKSFGGLLKFLKTGFNIKSKMLFSPLPKENLSNHIQKAFANNELCIINADSYYCPYYQLLYNKIHSRHGLLIKAFDIKNNTVEVIDTNSAIPYELDFDTVAAGFNSGSFINTILKLNGCNYTHNIDYKERMNTYLENSSTVSFINTFYENLNNYIHKGIDKDNKEFHIKRYLFAVKYQLLPYLKMRFHLFSINSTTQSTHDMKESVLLWTLLSDILWTLVPWGRRETLCELLNIEDYNEDSIYKMEDYSTDSIFEMLDKLRVLEDTIIRDFGKSG